MKKNYFPEEIVADLVNRYQLVDPQSSEAKQILCEMYPYLNQLIRTIIFLYRYDRFETVDDLISEGFEVIIRSMKVFDPNFVNSKGKKTTTFNYFSLVVKKALFYYTKSRQNHRNNPWIEETTLPLDYQSIDYSQHYIDIIEKNIIKYTPKIFKSNDQILLLDCYIKYLRQFKKMNTRLFITWLNENDYIHRFEHCNVNGQFRRFRKIIMPSLEISKKQILE